MSKTLQILIAAACFIFIASALTPFAKDKYKEWQVDRGFQACVKQFHANPKIFDLEACSKANLDKYYPIGDLAYEI
jgi:hypothetical protein